MQIKRPKGWRKGQTIVNFLEWLETYFKIDPFYMSDEDWDKFYKVFLALHKIENPSRKVR